MDRRAFLATVPVASAAVAFTPTGTLLAAEAPQPIYFTVVYHIIRSPFPKGSVLHQIWNNARNTRWRIE